MIPSKGRIRVVSGATFPVSFQQISNTRFRTGRLIGFSRSDFEADRFSGPDSKTAAPARDVHRLRAMHSHGIPPWRPFGEAMVAR